MVDDTRTVDSFDAPYGKQIEIIENAEESVTFLRVRIREKSRFTILDLDPVKVARPEKQAIRSGIETGAPMKDIVADDPLARL